MEQVRWGILGPGRIAASFAKGLAETETGRLTAIASRSAERRAAFGEMFGVDPARRHAAYEDLCADPDIDAIYVATPHPFHRRHALMVIGAGRHLALEKPAGISAQEVRDVVEAAAARGVFFMEAYMHLLHPQIARALSILREGRLGAVTHIRAAFGFAAPFSLDSRLYDPALAGGGILDVGGYTASTARLFAGAAEGRFLAPEALDATGLIGATGVDEAAMASLRFPNGVTAELSCAVSRDLGTFVEIRCENGSLTLPTPWLPGKDAGPADTVLIRRGADGEETIPVAAPKMLYAYEADAASRAILAGLTSLQYPAMGPADSIVNAEVLDAWLAACGVRPGRPGKEGAA